MRSFLSAETLQPETLNTPRIAEVTVPVIAELLEKIRKQLVELVQTTTNPLLEVLQKIPNPFHKELHTWSSERYLKTGNINEFTVDLVSYLDEYAALMPVVTYKYGPNGIQNGYKDSMSTIARNHLEKMKELGLPTERAQMELYVAEAVESWMASAPGVGSRLVGISPRGSKAELYPGLENENYVFFNNFVEESDGFLLQQYRSYDLNKNLPQLQASLQEAFSTTAILATTEPQKRTDLQTINRLIPLSPDVPLQKIEELIYHNKATWKVDIDKQLPNIIAEAYYAEVSKVTSLCVQTLEELLAAGENIEAATKKLDTLITTIKDALVKWVETHATNYEAIGEEAYDINPDELEQVWLATVAKDEGQRLSQEQRSLLQNFKQLTALNPRLPLKGLMSWGHCLAGTPFSMSSQLLKMQNLQLKALGINNGGLEAGMLSLNQQEKEQLAAELAQLVKITVNSEVWYVPADYLDEPGCYWDDEQQCVVGPCGIPLSQDYLARTEAEYSALMQHLLQQDFASDPDLAVDQKLAAITLLNLLESKLCKSSIGIDSWINNNVYVSNDLELGPQLKILHSQMEESTNPLLFLYSTVRDLVVQNDTEAIEALREECQTTSEIDSEVFIFDSSKNNTGKSFLFPQQPEFNRLAA